MEMDEALVVFREAMTVELEVFLVGKYSPLVVVQVVKFAVEEIVVFDSVVIVALQGMKLELISILTLAVVVVDELVVVAVVMKYAIVVVGNWYGLYRGQSFRC